MVDSLDVERERVQVRRLEAMVHSDNVIWRIAAIFIVLLALVILIVLYMVSAITDKLALTLFIVENFVLVLMVAVGFGLFVIFYLRGTLQAIKMQNETTHEQNRETNMALVQMAQVVMTIAVQPAALPQGRAAVPQLQPPTVTGREFWVNGRPPAEDVLKVITEDGQVLRWSADLAEHFIVGQWPRISRDAAWSRDKTKYVKTAEFLVAAGAPLEKAGNSYRWIAGTTRDALIQWYEDATSRRLVAS